MVRMVGGMHGWMTGCDARQEKKSKVKGHKEKKRRTFFLLTEKRYEVEGKGNGTLVWYRNDR
jgi:hypothetical protein